MFVVLHIADFSLQAVVRLEPGLTGRAVALLDDTRRPPEVVACTAAATAAGVRLGATAPQAMARCADVILRTRGAEADAEAGASLLAAAFSLAPHVEDTAPGVCTIEMTGVAAEEREPAVCAALAQLRQLGFSATAGLAPTPLLALFAARHGAIDPAAGSAGPGATGGEAGAAGAGKTREADRGIKPLLQLDLRLPVVGQAVGRSTSSCVCLRAGDVRAFLRDLPLAVAEPPADTAAVLEGWGVRTLGQLTTLTKADVTQRLGPAGLALWERAAGEVIRPLQRVVPPQSFTAEIDLEEPVDTLEPLLFVLRRFIDRLALELRNAGFVAGEMRLVLKLADETTHAHEFRLPEPTAREDILFRVLHTHLETLQTASEISGVRFSCRPVRPLTRQHGLFDSALRDPHGFAETLARVATVVGPDRVGTPVAEDTHRPDAVRLEAPAAVVPPPDEAAERPLHGPPLRRFRPPLVANVELQGRAPAFVWTPSLAGTVCARSGPWRGSGEWWDAARAWRREEWDVQLETGGLYRLLHTPDGWFVEGEYD